MAGILKQCTPLLKIVCTGIVAFTAWDFTFEIITFSGPSMEPLIHNKDYGLSEKLTSFKKLQRGDIVIAIHPNKPPMRICKRILALEGDFVKYADYIQDEDGNDVHAITREKVVPRGHVWLEGDNLSNSYDSRYYGAVPIGLVTGRVFLKIASWRDFSWIPRSSSTSISEQQQRVTAADAGKTH